MNNFGFILIRQKRGDGKAAISWFPTREALRDHRQRSHTMSSSFDYEKDVYIDVGLYVREYLEKRGLAVSGASEGALVRISNIFPTSFENTVFWLGEHFPFGAMDALMGLTDHVKAAARAATNWEEYRKTQEHMLLDRQRFIELHEERGYVLHYSDATFPKTDAILAIRGTNSLRMWHSPPKISPTHGQRLNSFRRKEDAREQAEEFKTFMLAKLGLRVWEKTASGTVWHSSDHLVGCGCWVSEYEHPITHLGQDCPGKPCSRVLKKAKANNIDIGYDDPGAATKKPKASKKKRRRGSATRSVGYFRKSP